MFKKNISDKISDTKNALLCWSLLFNKGTDLRSATLLKKKLLHSFPVRFAKFLRTRFLQNTPE